MKKWAAHIVIAGLLIAAVAIRVISLREHEKGEFMPYVYAQGPSNVQPQPDCIINIPPMTANGSQPSNGTGASSGAPGFDNRNQGCNVWSLSYNITGLSTATITLQSAPNLAGIPGTWATYANQVVTGGTSGGANPSTITSGAAYVTLTGYNPWVRVLDQVHWGYGVVRVPRTGGEGRAGVDREASRARPGPPERRARLGATTGATEAPGATGGAGGGGTATVGTVLTTGRHLHTREHPRAHDFTTPLISASVDNQFATDSAWSGFHQRASNRTAPPAVGALNRVNRGGAAGSNANGGLLMTFPASSSDNSAVLDDRQLPRHHRTLSRSGSSLTYPSVNYYRVWNRRLGMGRSTSPSGRPTTTTNRVFGFSSEGLELGQHHHEFRLIWWHALPDCARADHLRDPELTTEPISTPTSVATPTTYSATKL